VAHLPIASYIEMKVKKKCVPSELGNLSSLEQIHLWATG